MKIVTIVGARPQFIKAAVLSRAFDKDNDFDEIIIHTGQHYDADMSEIFFKQLEIPLPKYNLKISGGSHGNMIGRMICKIEDVLLIEKPDYVLVYGDTNSTIAGAISASKLCIPIIHIESGGRIGNINNPEEINRIVTDHISTILFSCTESAMQFLAKEGLKDKAYLVGDPMYDAFKFYSSKVGDNAPETLIDLDGKQINCPKEFYYLTCHRQENTDEEHKLVNILDAMETLDKVCIYPVHPRNRNSVKCIKNTKAYHNIYFIKPVSYLMSIYLINHAKKIVTDSGGLQREAFFAQKQCITIFEYIAWPETMVGNRNQLARPQKDDILYKLSKPVFLNHDNAAFGDGNAAIKIIDILKRIANDKK